VLIGCVNAIVVVGLRVDSFIATLGTGGILAAITLAMTNDTPVAGRVGGAYSDLAVMQVSGVQLPVLYFLALIILMGWWLDRTQMGRLFYAIGFDREAARLTGIATRRLSVIGLLTSSTISGFTGLVLAAQVSSGSPDIGSPYLIPAFSACFLGATQFRRGRFNPWGTAVAVLLLGTLDLGLLISGGPSWTPQLLDGVVLIVAVALAGSESQRRGRGVFGRRFLSRHRTGSADEGVDRSLDAAE
jgi:ribose transport system permease protein